ncbi:MAG: hypothetical protein K0S38_700 [Candidatus Paceibacter sp.]|nr:hypothetical protein [Candidatus Paceibacter sp.]
MVQTKEKLEKNCVYRDVRVARPGHCRPCRELYTRYAIVRERKQLLWCHAGRLVRNELALHSRKRWCTAHVDEEHRP